MKTIKKTRSLKLAIEAEKSAILASQVLYKSLTLKIKNFQTGRGVQPTEEEFKLWIAEVEKAVELKRVLNGISGV